MVMVGSGGNKQKHEGTKCKPVEGAVGRGGEGEGREGGGGAFVTLVATVAAADCCCCRLLTAGSAPTNGQQMFASLANNGRWSTPISPTTATPSKKFNPSMFGVLHMLSSAKLVEAFPCYPCLALPYYAVLC